MVARTYNLATDFGDTYDHMSDALFGALFIAVTAKTLKGKHRNLSLILITIFMLSFVINMGCIEKECGKDCKETPTVSKLKKLCFAPNFFKFTDNTTLMIRFVVGILIR